MKARFTLLLLSLSGMLTSPAGAERSRRLPAGYHEGRCLYVEHGKRRIAGRCFYKLDKDGGFHIDGPRQVFGGTDTVDRGSDATTYSRDWWADVFADEGGWSGYGNEGIHDVHGGRLWSLHRRGACFLGEGVRVCLWRK